MGSLDVEVAGPAAEVRDLIRATMQATFVLHFTPSRSLMQREGPEVMGDSEVRIRGLTRGDVDELTRVFAARRAHEAMALQTVYISGEDDAGAVTAFRSADPEQAYVVETAAPQIEWEITGERGEHEGRILTRAVATVGPDELEAWFDPEIPVSGGPALYGGLPGMILVLQFNGGQAAYAATEIALGEVDEGLIQRPEGGIALSPEEYRDEQDDRVAGIARLLNGMIQNFRDVNCRIWYEGRLQLQCNRARESS